MQVSPAEYLGCFIDDPQERVLTLAFNESAAMTPTVRTHVLYSIYYSHRAEVN